MNMPALRMAANLVSRRIAPAVAQVELDAPPPASADGAVTAPIHAPAAARSQGIPGMRRFRGRTVD